MRIRVASSEVISLVPIFLGFAILVKPQVLTPVVHTSLASIRTGGKFSFSAIVLIGVLILSYLGYLEILEGTWEKQCASCGKMDCVRM